MGKFRVIEEWTSYRIVEIAADNEDMAVDLVQAGEGNEIDNGTDNHYTHAELVQIDGNTRIYHAEPPIYTMVGGLLSSFEWDLGFANTGVIIIRK